MHGCGKGLASSLTEFIFNLIYNIYKEKKILIFFSSFASESLGLSPLF